MIYPAFRVTENLATKAPKAYESEFFTGQSLHMLSRVRDHIERIDNGAVYAVDDLAVVLRAMLGDGKGNNVLLRMYRQSGLKIEVQLSRAPDSTAAHFSVGSIPTDCSNAKIDGARWVPLHRWPGETVVQLGVKNKRTSLSWRKFLELYSNKWGGAHLDPELPVELPIIDVYEAGGFQLSAYLLRTAGVQTWHLGQIIMSQMLGLNWEHYGTALKSLVAPGGMSEPPRDRRAFGALQWLTYTSSHDRNERSTTSAIAYFERDSMASIRISGGGKLTYNVTYQGVATTSPDQVTVPTQRAREPITPREISISGQRVMQTYMVFRNFNDVDPT
jgi:hypothetical protein